MKHIYIIALCLLTYFSFEEQLNAQAGRVTGSSTDSTSTIYTGSDSLNQAGLTHVKFADDYSQGLIFGSYGGTTFNTNSYDNIGLFADIYNNYRVGMAYGDGLDEANIWIQPYILSENIKESDTGNYYRSNKQVNSVNTGIKFGNKVYTHIERFNEDQTSIHGGSINDQLRYGGTNGGQMVANFEDHDDYHWLVQRGYGASAKNLFRVTLDTTGSDNDSIFIFDKYALPNAVPTSDGSAYAIHWTNGIPTFAAAGGGGGDGNGLLTASNDDGVIPSGMDLDIADTLTFNKTNSDPALSILGSTGALSFNEYGTGIFGTGAEVTRMFGIDATGSLLDNAALYQFVGSGTASGIVAHSTAAAGFDNPTNSQFIANGQGVLAFSSPKVGLGSYTFAANGAVIGGMYGYVTNISGTSLQLDFQVGPTPATNTALQLETDLDVVYPGYAAGAKDGTPTKTVGLDVDGKMVTFDAATGADSSLYSINGTIPAGVNRNIAFGDYASRLTIEEAGYNAFIFKSDQDDNAPFTNGKNAGNLETSIKIGNEYDGTTFEMGLNNTVGVLGVYNGSLQLNGTGTTNIYSGAREGASTAEESAFSDDIDSFTGHLAMNSGGHTFSDGTVSLNGLKYGADYSATYVDRSLVDKEYVDAAILAGSGNGLFTAANNGDTISSGFIAYQDGLFQLMSANGNKQSRLLLSLSLIHI